MFSSRFLQGNWPTQWFRLLTQWLCVPTQWLCVLYYRGKPLQTWGPWKLFSSRFLQRFFARAKSWLHAHFFQLFWQFSRPLSLFFARFIDTICTGTCLRICREKFCFTAYLKGKLLKILHVYFLISTGKTSFLRALFRDFSCFYTSTFFFYRAKIETFARVNFGFARPKKTLCKM